jgi:TolB-like protein
MADVFISYARSSAKQAQAVAGALRSLGYAVWIDDDLPAHRTYGRVIEEQMTAAKAALVIWSADAVQSEWVLSEANRAREDRKLVQVTTDKTRLPMPFDTIQCADLAGWNGDLESPGWRKVVSSVADLVRGPGVAAASVADTPLPLPSKPSIAVLPFANLSGDLEQDYFADGMVVEIAEALSRIKSIFVIASGSSLSLKGKGVSPRDAARQLGVRYVLEGSVRKAGGRVRIGVQLIDAADGAQIWTHRFDDTLEDVFALQDRVAISVAGKIEPTVRLAETQRALSRPTGNMNSYDLCLRAVFRRDTYEKVGTLEALELANRAIALDPDYGEALAIAASCNRIVADYGWADDPDANRRQAIELAHRALSAAGDNSTVLARIANVVATLEGDLDAALGIIGRAIDQNPGSAIAWSVSGMLHLRAGQSELAIEHAETAMRLDPLGPGWPGHVLTKAVALFFQERLSEAVTLAREVARQVDSAGAYAILAASYGLLGQPEAAAAALARYRALASQPVGDLARAHYLDAAQLRLFLDGLALAEGNNPADSRARAPLTSPAPAP